MARKKEVEIDDPEVFDEEPVEDSKTPSKFDVAYDEFLAVDEDVAPVDRRRDPLRR
jgi:hypothetical protein